MNETVNTPYSFDRTQSLVPPIYSCFMTLPKQSKIKTPFLIHESWLRNQISQSQRQREPTSAPEPLEVSVFAHEPIYRSHNGIASRPSPRRSSSPLSRKQTLSVSCLLPSPNQPPLSLWSRGFTPLSDLLVWLLRPSYPPTITLCLLIYNLYCR